MAGSARSVERLAWDKFAEFAYPAWYGTFINEASGSVFFVDSVAGNIEKSGRTPANPCATIAQALASARAVTSRHAVILVAPWHTETIDADGDLDVDENDVSVIGLGGGDNRPLLTISTATDANITVSGSGCLFANMRISMAIDACATPIVMSGAGSTLKDIDYVEASACEAVDVISVGAVARVTLENIRIEGINTTDGDADSAIHLNGCDQLVIRNVVARGGDWADGVIQNETDEVLDLLIENCTLQTEATENKIMAFDSAATGFIRNVTARLAGADAVKEIGNAFSVGDCNMHDVYVAVQDTDVCYPADASSRIDSRLGIMVSKATADVLTGSAVNIFTIAGGRVLVKGIIGEITTQIGAVQCFAQFTYTPTAGEAQLLNAAAVTDFNADAVGTLFSPTGRVADEVAKMGQMFEGPLVLEAGVISITMANTTGSVKFDLWYVPLEAGASVVSA